MIQIVNVAVVILNWNGSSWLEQFLPSVVQYSETDGATVYVADNGSTDGSQSLIESRFPSVRLLPLGENLGFAEGYNRALEQVEAKYVVLLNSDVEVTLHWLRPLTDYLDAHAEVAACQPKVLSWHAREHFEYAGACGGFIDRYGYPYCRGRIMGNVEQDRGQYDDALRVFWATGAALCIRLADYRAAGGLDGRFFAHMEEVDLCWRLWARGRQVACVPQSVVYHVGGGTLQKENPQKTFLNFRNNLLMLWKNLPAAELRRVMPVRWLLDYVAAFVFLLKGEWRSAWMVAKARREFRRIRAGFVSDRPASGCLVAPSQLPCRNMRGSILWAYYVRWQKTFSSL